MVVQFMVTQPALFLAPATPLALAITFGAVLLEHVAHSPRPIPLSDLLLKHFAMSKKIVD